MLDLYTTTEVTDGTVLPNSTPNQATFRPRQQATHWTRRLPDPLGAALLKLRSTRTTLKAVDAASASWERGQTFPGPSISPQRVAEAELFCRELPVQSDDQAGLTIPVSGEDRRAFPRRQSECLVTVLHRCETQHLKPRETDCLLQNGRLVGRLLDISQTGLCLMLGEVIADNSELVLRISNQHLNRHVDASAQVIHSQHAGHGRFSIHCRVLRDFNLSELQDLGRPLIVGHVLA